MTWWRTQLSTIAVTDLMIDTAIYCCCQWPDGGHSYLLLLSATWWRTQLSTIAVTYLMIDTAIYCWCQWPDGGHSYLLLLSATWWRTQLSTIAVTYLMVGTAFGGRFPAISTTKEIILGSLVTLSTSGTVTLSFLLMDCFRSAFSACNITTNASLRSKHLLLHMTSASSNTW